MLGSDWAIYLAALLGPFVQEDAAVLAAASAGTMGHAHPALMFAATLVGLAASDVWKYWAGRLAHRSRRASKWAADPRVQTARERVLKRLGVTLLVARFVPGTRMPLYFACGVFKAPFVKFFTLMVATGALYIALAFALFATLGRVVGEQVRAYAPFIVIALVAALLGVSWLRARRKAQR